MRKGFLVVLCLFVAAVFVMQADIADAKQKKIVVKNNTTASAKVFINFGADSGITKSKMGSICTRGASNLNCGFDLAAGKDVTIPNDGYLPVNMTIAFNKDIGCGSTKAELNVNKTGSAGDAANVSLVDGFNEKIKMVFERTGAAPVVMGPPCGIAGNEKVFGVYPYGCDGCAVRKAPQSACGPYPAGNQGCHAGSEYNPQIPCQYNFNQSTEANGTLTISLEAKDAKCTPK